MRQGLPVCLILLLAAIILAFSGSALEAARPEPANAPTLPTGVPQPQGFCGYCHLLTYPEIFNRSHDTWQADKHNKVGCVECHYGSVPVAEPRQAMTPHQGAPPQPKAEHFSIVALGGKTIQTRPIVPDSACLTAACHGNPQDTFKTKPIVYREKIKFLHDPHLAAKNQVAGQKINCASCHQHQSEKKHFEVTSGVCHLCHFANTAFDQGRARCESCHDLPAKPVQSVAGDKPITHQMLKDSGAACVSCHLDLLQNSPGVTVKATFEQGQLKTVPMIAVSAVKVENCLNCHDEAANLAKAPDKVLMHQSHVAKDTARCFDCHLPVRHAKGDIKEPMPTGCASCHTDPHKAQRTLIVGAAHGDVAASPDPMFKSRTNCLGCHVEEKLTAKGDMVRTASAKTCVACHTKDYEQMFGMWRAELTRSTDKAKALEREALQAIAKYEASGQKEKLEEARNMIQQGREYLVVVLNGNGVHNAKYSGALVDAAAAWFKNAAGFLEGRVEESAPAREE